MSAAVDPTARSRDVAGAARRLVTEGPAGVTVGLAILVVTLTVIAPSSFPTFTNLSVIARSAAITILVGLAQMVVIAAGGMNLSVGAVGGLVAITAGGLMMAWQLPTPVAVLGGLAAGIACGAANGILIARTGISPFVVTLASASVFTGINLGLTESQPYYQLPQDLQDFGAAELFGVPVIFIVAIVVALLVGLLFRYVTVGRQVLVFGANPRAAQLAGVPTSRVQVLVYALSGLLSACAAIILIARLGSAQPTAGSDWLLISFAAPILGGVLLAGGYVTVIGTVLGALLLTVLANGLVHLKVDPYYVQLLLGLIILVAAGLDRIRQYSAARVGRQERGRR